MLGFALILTACGSASHTTVANPVTHACETSGSPASPTARRLVSAIATLDAAPRPDDHVALLAAMRALGDSLETVAPGRATELARVRAMSDALERAVGNPDAHANFVRIGLVAAWQGLAAAAPRSGCYRSGLETMIDAADRIDPDRRLAAQYLQVKASLHAASAAVLAADTAELLAARR